MVTMSRRPLTSQEERDLNTQLAFFWNGRTPEERNAYANVLVFLILTGEDPLASAAFEVIVHEIIKNSSTLLPFSIDHDEEFRAAVAVAVMDKLRGSKRRGKQPEPWQRLVASRRPRCRRARRASRVRRGCAGAGCRCPAGRAGAAACRRPS